MTKRQNSDKNCKLVTPTSFARYAIIMMTINDYKDFARMDFQKIVTGLGRGWYITNIAIIGARMPWVDL